MTERKSRPEDIDVKGLLAGDEAFIRTVVRTALQEVLEAEMTEAVGAAKGERTASQVGYRSGYYGRTLIRPDADHAGRQSGAQGTAGPGGPLLDRAVRTLSALRAGTDGGAGGDARAGLSTRKVKAITEELCGHSFSASSISAINKKLDKGVAQFARRRLTEAFPYLILDARYEKVRKAGVIAGQAVLVAIGIDWVCVSAGLPVSSSSLPTTTPG